MSKYLIPIQKICETYQVNELFFENLQEYNLISLIKENNEFWIEENELNKIEKIMRLHFDLDINMEGIDVIISLLNKINQLNKEISFLQKQLKIYEDLQ